MDPRSFPYDRFNALIESKEKRLLDLISGRDWFVPVMQRPGLSEQFGSLSGDRVKSLAYQLDFLHSYFDLESDFIYDYLEPWHGVGIYAAAFGCPLYWSPDTAPQTKPLYHTAEEVVRYKKPDIDGCEVMQMVLDTIHYFRQQTGDQLAISLTDTQSPNDTASLIVDTCEFFVLTRTDEDLVLPLLQDITDTIIRFSERQLEALGPTATRPGHLMTSSRKLKGISLSDDNMAVLDPLSYRIASKPFNEQLSRHFGGLAIHTCGDLTHTAPALLESEGLYMVDCPIGWAVDPTPNDPKALRDLFAGSGLLLKVRLGANELELLEPLIDPALKLVVELRTSGSTLEKNRQVEAAREAIARYGAGRS